MENKNRALEERVKNLEETVVHLFFLAEKAWLHAGELEIELQEHIGIIEGPRWSTTNDDLIYHKERLKQLLVPVDE